MLNAIWYIYAARLDDDDDDDVAACHNNDDDDNASATAATAALLFLPSPHLCRRSHSRVVVPKGAVWHVTRCPTTLISSCPARERTRRHRRKYDSARSVTNITSSRENASNRQWTRDSEPIIYLGSDIRFERCEAFLAKGRPMTNRSSALYIESPVARYVVTWSSMRTTRSIALSRIP